MNELELIEKALTDAYTFVKEKKQTPETGDLLVLLFKAKLLLKNCTISAVISTVCEHEWKADTFDCYGNSISMYCDDCGAKQTDL